MFSQEIHSTCFTGDIAGRVMSNISNRYIPFADYAARDVSLISTIRALVSHRMGENEKITICGSSYCVPESDYNSFHYTVDTMISHYTQNISEDSGIVVINTFGRDSDFNMKYVSDHFLELYPDFIRVNKVTEFFKKSFNIICFIRPSLKQVAIFLPRVNVSQIHFLQCAIPAIFPWYFPEEKGLSESEMKVLTSLKHNKYQDYIDALNVISEEYDFRTEFIRATLNNVVTIFDRRRKDELSRRISSLSNDISNCMARIGEYLTRRAYYEAELIGIETKLNSQDGDSELVEYFCCNKKLDLISLYGTTIEFVVKDYIEYYDEDLAERMISNPRSIAYMSDGRQRNASLSDGMKKLLTEIFIKRKLKLKTCAAYNISIGGGCAAISNYEFDRNTSNNFLANPHIQYYTCMGTYSQIVSELMAEKKYVEAIEQCIASARSLNFGDSVVFSRFMRIMYSEENTKKCIELPDKTCVTVREAIQWIENNQE